ncbi:MAG: NYN domain-containing protein [Candidatus Heimdallarchaeaceae archaeon]
MKKAIFFVDANNWYHNVKKFFPPGDIDIKKIVELLAEAKQYEIVEIRWYASTPSIKDGERMYYRHMSYLEHLEKVGIRVIKRKLQRLSNEEILKKKKETIEELDLCEHCKPLIESVFLDLADLKKKEKGIDVWVAVDMLRKCLIEKVCEVCVLISGDADFVPALELIKKNGNEVLTSMVPWGYSSELRRKFPFFILRKETLMKCFREYKDKK